MPTLHSQPFGLFFFDYTHFSDQFLDIPNILIHLFDECFFAFEFGDVADSLVKIEMKLFAVQVSRKTDQVRFDFEDILPECRIETDVRRRRLTASCGDRPIGSAR